MRGIHLFSNTWTCILANHLFSTIIYLTHWGQVTHICITNLTIIGSDNGLSPGRCQAIFWTSAGILLIGPLGTNFNEILIAIHKFSFKKMHLKMSSGKWRPFCLGLNVLTHWPLGDVAKFLETQLHEWYLEWCSVKGEMKSLIHSQTSPVAPL